MCSMQVYWSRCVCICLCVYACTALSIRNILKFGVLLLQWYCYCFMYTHSYVYGALFALALPQILAYKFGSTLTHWPQFFRYCDVYTACSGTQLSSNATQTSNKRSIEFVCSACVVCTRFVSISECNPLSFVPTQKSLSGFSLSLMQRRCN